MPLIRSTFLKRLLAGLALATAATLALGQTWQASVDTVQGLPTLSKGGTPALKSAYVFWGANWSWADTTTQFKVTAPYTYSVTGRNATLGFDLTANAKKTSATQMVWDFDLNAAAPIYNIIGGGISFKFDLTTFGAEMGTPALLPDKSGWTWGPSGGNHVEMRFSPIPGYVFMEPGSKNEVRVFFYNGSVAAGHTRYTGTLTIAGDMAFTQTLTERFGFADPTQWPSDVLDWKTSPVDLSFLNQPEIPAGRHGFLRASGERLAFADGTVARFWGTNVAAYALFGTSSDGIRQQARRLSQLGFNLVRIHHHDSPWVSPNIFGPSSVTNTLSLSASSLDKLDLWIKSLKDEGIYVWLDMHTMRFLKAGDQIDYFNEISKGKPDGDLKGFDYVNGSIQRAMRDFSQAYVNHLNPYTGLRYKDDPAIVAVQVTNENDLTHHYGNSLLPDKNVPSHNAIYMDEARKFANTWGLSTDATWHSWEYGPSKLFLNDLEYRVNSAMINDLRSAGVKVPIISTSSWGGMPLSSLPALTAGNVIDAHAYGGTGELDRNPLYSATFAGWLAAAQVAGRPLTVSEWNLENFPAPDRHAAPLFLAGNASLQGWDGLMQYAYSQAALDSASVPSNWHAYSDPALIATLPAAALLYRQGHVKESSTVYAFAPTQDQLFNQLVSPTTAVALRTAVEKGKLVVVLPATRELPWLEKGAVPAGATVITNPQQSFIAGGATAVTSDTGELQRDWGQGIYTINTPRTQAAMGWLGDKNIRLPDVAISVTTPSATVAVQALDGQPISTSRNLMVSLGARAVPVNNQMPYYAEPVTGRVTVRAPSGMKLYKRGTDGVEKELPVTYSNGVYTLNLDTTLHTYWLFLKSQKGRLPGGRVGPG
ncbi:MAG TPA: cellulase family glycosylhydrolase [Rhodocyclaceae bacterium]|nr:cellulase family glycosylhydrolase [Rhodocyclaceae bacterium]